MWWNKLTPMEKLMEVLGALFALLLPIFLLFVGQLWEGLK